MTQPRDYAALLPDEAAVTRWAAGLVLPGTPLFGSPEWVALDDEELRVSSAVRAGVAYVAETVRLPYRLAAELVDADLDVVARVRAAALDVADGTAWGTVGRQIRDRRAWQESNPWAVRQVTA
ncbi:MAG TPA: hypothetical protein PK331_07945 [Gordonia sp. (in: high G+C Gram-positive bacteria)]|uniref:hypothetical protein n=1 Tax=unclassified Gordonia (in: high G+C Gram-positive bacteria) TaxID=2657482 RepID=UPI000F90A1CB|nr:MULTISPECIES: hypothetical protein [unclassified Gordonia (in: high G+C Gram-positive bacteria)]RTL04237.1 MAG: hypothetical protein EKK62_16740 [Acidimicrobiia bacterium]HNP57414.1 hypothetical protein [Gordonia sp. (in: high G+C Gram-positive bacteria)]HRC50837.1 hypothetical protein [Gordonia sp. (in: high G+C Gram-positive bacteria)]